MINLINFLMTIFFANDMVFFYNNYWNRQYFYFSETLKERISTILHVLQYLNTLPQPTRVQDLSAVNVTSQSQADRVNRNAYRYSVVTLVLFICK